MRLETLVPVGKTDGTGPQAPQTGRKGLRGKGSRSRGNGICETQSSTGNQEMEETIGQGNKQMLALRKKK